MSSPAMNPAPAERAATKGFFGADPDPSDYLRISDDLVERALRPYHAHCKYLTRAWVAIDAQIPRPGSTDAPFSVLADFTIDESCYIASTGHFNAVEFLICMNQIGYVALAYAAENRLFGDLWPAANDASWFFRHQLSHVLILDQRSRYRSMITPAGFRGSYSWHGTSCKRSLTLVEAALAYWDDEGGRAEGSATGGLRR